MRGAGGGLLGGEERGGASSGVVGGRRGCDTHTNMCTTLFVPHCTCNKPAVNTYIHTRLWQQCITASTPLPPVPPPTHSHSLTLTPSQADHCQHHQGA